MKNCQECDRMLSETDEQMQCPNCDMSPLCEECYDEYHAHCAEINEDWDVDEDVQEYFNS
jgi:hypothetical protein